MSYHVYAIKHLDENGFTAGYGYAESVNEYKSGDIVTDPFGNKILIDFEMSKNNKEA